MGFFATATSADFNDDEVGPCLAVISRRYTITNAYNNDHYVSPIIFSIPFREKNTLIGKKHLAVCPN